MALAKAGLAAVLTDGSAASAVAFASSAAVITDRGATAASTCASSAAGEFSSSLSSCNHAHRETEDSFHVMGMPAQPDQDLFRSRRAAIYSGLKSKAGLIAAKAAPARQHEHR